MSSDSESRFMTVEEVAELLGFHQRTVYEKADRGEIPVVRIGRALRFDRQQIEAWIAKGGSPASAA